MGECDILAFGELLWDKLPSGAVLGGAPANFALRAQELGASVVLMSRIGDDELGRRTTKELSDKGINQELIQVDSTHPTGTVDVTIESGSPDYVIHRDVAYDFIECPVSALDCAAQAKLIYFGSLIQRAPRSEESLYRLLHNAPQARVFVDINLRKDCFSEATIRKSLEHADILKLNEHEVIELGRLFGQAFHSNRDFFNFIADNYTVRTCLITKGERGAEAYSLGGTQFEVPGEAVQVKDSVGAGDAFSAGFVVALLQGLSLQRACEVGNRLGACITTKPGGMAPLLSEEVKQIQLAP